MQRIKDAIMAIVLMEEVIMGLGEVKESLDHAVIILEDMIEDISPNLRHELQGMLEKELLHPLLSRRNVLDNLLVSLVEAEEED
jgi:prefoldin subunit 5